MLEKIKEMPIKEKAKAMFEKAKAVPVKEKVNALLARKKTMRVIAVILVAALAIPITCYFINNNGPRGIRRIANKNGYELGRFEKLESSSKKSSLAQLITTIDGTSPVNIAELGSEEDAVGFALGYIRPAIQNTDIPDPEKDLKKDGCYMFIVDDFYNIVCYKDNVAAWSVVGINRNGIGRDEHCIKETSKLMKELGFNVTGDAVQGKTAKADVAAESAGKDKKEEKQLPEKQTGAATQ